MNHVDYLECPAVFDRAEYNEEDDYPLSVFLAGGISNCRNWQQDIVPMFDKAVANNPVMSDKNWGFKLVLVNPRRANFDITNPNMSSEQIEWEHSHLQKANATLFWFPPETLCPITLFELGVAASRHRVIFVGCDPDYQRKFDVVKQLSLIDAEIKVVFTLEELVDQVVKHFETI